MKLNTHTHTLYIKDKYCFLLGCKQTPFQRLCLTWLNYRHHCYKHQLTIFCANCFELDATGRYVIFIMLQSPTISTWLKHGTDMCRKNNICKIQCTITLAINIRFRSTYGNQPLILFNFSEMKLIINDNFNLAHKICMAPFCKHIYL